MSGKTEDKNSSSGRSYEVCMKVNVPGQQRGRRAGSLEPMDTIFVKQVKEGGPAERAGLRTGDRIVSVNGESVTGKTYSQVIALIQSSDSSLKLLVVPRDEDILQMAYQNSAYNQGQEPYKGHACEIPEPPALATRVQKNTMAPRFKSELSVMPEEEHREVRESIVVGNVEDHAYSAPPQAHPPTPVRSSSKNVVLSHIQNMGGHSPNSENVNNFSDSSVTSSTDNQPSQNGQAAAKSRAPYLQYRPAPYARSQTTSSLQQQREGPDDRSTYSSTSSLPSTGRSNSLPVSHLFTSSTYVEPYSQPYESSLYSSPHQSEDLRPSRNVDSSSPSQSKWTHHSISAADPNKMGGTVTVRYHNSSGGVQQMEFPRYQGSGPDHGSSVVISTGRHSISDQYGINLSERMRKFDSADSIDSSGSSNQRFHVSLTQPSDVPSMGLDSVASRIAHYESEYSDGSRSDDERYRPRRYSADDHQRTRYGSPLAQTRPPAELSQMTSSPPATISIYFRSDHVPSPTNKVQPSPERLLRQAHSQDRDLSLPGERITRDRSPLGLRDQYFSPPYMRRTNKAAARQASFLAAVNSPHNQGSQSQSAPPSLTVSAELDSWQPGQTPSDPIAPSQGVPQNAMPEVVGTTASTTSTVIGGATVVMRQQSTPEDREAKLVRRTSYMMATSKDTATLGGIGDVRHEMSKSDSHLLPSQMQHPVVMIEPVVVEEVHCAPPPLPPIAVPEIIEDTTDGGPGSIKKKLSVDLSAAKLVPAETKAEDTFPTTPPKASSNIRKLKAFFGEKTPRIHEVTTDRSRIFDMPKPGETVKEGMLNCKMAIADGKKAADRSWKPMFVLLKGHALYLFKDKASASSSSPTWTTEEQPISVKSCMVDIAYDYTKKKNVFRLTTYNGSEYLFQTEDHDSMIDWIKAIQANNDPDEDVQNKLSKSLPSKTALRSKSPASHSPSIRQKKTSDKDHVESPKGKEGESKGNRNWKGRMAKKFKRYGSSSSAPAEAESESEVTGTFGVHLDMCPPSTFSEFIPSAIELCTKVVEERGIENQGIYRVPGNTGAVNVLQEEINKDPYGQDIDCDKWLDVNVVSSLLKSFFRKLPESLITDDLYECIIAANRTENPEKRMLKIKKVLHELPDHNFETFRFIAGHLNRVSEMGHVNKMYARNLAIVFGPTLVRKKDESMVSMVKDMSDQCRIVESIIVHPDWFFSSWDVDDHVPIDNDGDESGPVSGMNQELLTKAENLELGERGRDLSAKDLVSSIISAANRKKKKKDKLPKVGDTIEPDVPSTGSEPSYNERNIDREIELRRVKEQLHEESSETVMSTIKESVSSTSVVSSSSSAGSTATVVSSTNLNKKTVACNVSVKETKDSSDKQGVYSAKMVLLKQKDSEESMTSSSTTSEETQGSRLPPVTKFTPYQHEGFRSYPDQGKASMHRRFSEDVLSERRGDDEVAQRFGGRVSYQTQQQMRRLQMETQQLRQREEERRAAQERLALDKRRVEMEMAKTRAELEEEEREERGRMHDKADTSSITSDYSTTSSSVTAHDGKPHSSTTPLSSHSDYSSNASPASLRYQDSHCYHLNSSSENPKELQHSICDIRRSKGALSDFDTSRVAGKGTLSRRKGPPNASVRRTIEESDDLSAVETFQRSGSYKRKGSLDSLREAYAAGERSCASSDSGDDMVKSLASTFDQKLRTYTSSSDQPSTNDCGRGAPEGSSAPSMFILPKPLPYTHSSQGDLGRFSRGDPKVGIASRFERKNSSSGSSVASSHSPLHKANTADHAYAQLSSPAAAQRPGHQDSGKEESKPSHNWNSSDNRTAISKSEKTDANRQQQVRDAQTTDYVAALRKGSEKIYGSREKLLQDSDDGEPGSRRRDPTRKRAVARRHTVGGTNDPEHFNALLSVNKAQDDSMYAQSAWDRLQPGGQSYMASPSLVSWTEQERRRMLGSSPAIFSHILWQPVPDHVGAGPPAKFTFESAI